ncbi:MAG: type transport system ATP-binding protein [Chloroflexia bacterium]|jgi:ABC-2 type transport system ATP-binding protein|nr:type transport system ATP-binding protein [Chloroflexia bacterium]
MNAIETRGLTRKFGDRLAVDQLDLAIPRGQVFGFLGPNGAGKTTTVRMLSAIIAPTSGTATVNGHMLGDGNSEIRRSVGILTETPGLYEKLTAMQNLEFFAGLYEVEEQAAKQAAERYLKLMDLWERRDDKVGGFSKGMRQKLAIARALLHDPAIVFLDEPTAGLDPEAARTVHEFIKNLRSEGRTVFLTTHNLSEADTLCDLIGVFRTRLLTLGSPRELRSRLFGTGTLVTVAGEAEKWAALVKALPFVKQVTAGDGTLSVALDDPDSMNPLLVQALVGAGAFVRYVQPSSHSLEEVYLQLVSG